MPTPMSKLTHKTAVVIIPPPACWQPIQRLRQQYDRKIDRWMPHITLIYPFLPVERFDEARDTLMDACASIDSFEISLSQFHSFRHRHNKYTIWLAPKPEKPLIELHTALCASLIGIVSQEKSSRPFRPHLSVGQVRGKHRLQDLIARLNDEWATLHFEVNEISLIWRNDPPKDHFQVASAIPLRPGRR